MKEFTTLPAKTTYYHGADCWTLQTMYASSVSWYSPTTRKNGIYVIDNSTNTIGLFVGDKLIKVYKEV